MISNKSPCAQMLRDSLSLQDTYPGVGLLGSLGTCIFSFPAYCQIVLQKGFINSHSHHQCISVSFSLHALQTFSFLFILWVSYKILLWLSISLIFSETDLIFKYICHWDFLFHGLPTQVLFHFSVNSSLILFCGSSL